MKVPFSPEELKDIELQEPFPFTKGVRTMKIEGRPWIKSDVFGTMLFDCENDPGQEHPLDAPAAEARMTEHLARLMRENAAPAEQFERLGL